MRLFHTVIAVALACARGELVMVYNIHRHGVPNYPAKNCTGAWKNAGGPTLHYAGAKQCYDSGMCAQFCRQVWQHSLCLYWPTTMFWIFSFLHLGAKFRERYIDAATCNDTCLVPQGEDNRYGPSGFPGVGFSNYNTLVNSSALHRTILAANNFFLAVFGGVDSTKEPYLAVQVTGNFSLAYIFSSLFI